MNKEKDMENKNRKGSLADRIPHQVWLLISFAAAMALWTLLSVIPATSRAFPNVFKVLGSIKTMIDRGVLWKDISSSLISVISGYALGFVIALPVAILMAWYKPVRFVIEPWIQFIRNIPPLAYVPLIVIAAGVGRKPQIIVITIACFLIMCVTIYQGVTLGGTGKDTGKRHPTIGDDVVIGAGAKVLGPFTVGTGSKVGAGSIVLKEVPPNCTVVGNPGRIVRKGSVRCVGPDLDQIHLPDPVKDRVEELQRRIEQLETCLARRAEGLTCDTCAQNDTEDCPKNAKEKEKTYVDL